ncbi:hypothetical protein AcW1_001549 [Taiwanofungus camphoratus]|nr:hypothetical protein AcW1_001549 [Antrodia cinnamomea]
MQSPHSKRSLDACREELDAKLELLSQLCLQDVDDSQAPDSPSNHRDRSSYRDAITDQWIQAEYRWALEAADDSAVSLPDLFDGDFEDDGDVCMPQMYDPGLFTEPRCPPCTPTRRSLKLHQRAYSEKDKPLPEIPRPSLVRSDIPDAPPPSPRTPRSPFPPSVSNTPPRSPLVPTNSTPPNSPRISSSPPNSPKSRTFPRSPPAPVVPLSVSPSKASVPRPTPVQRHATYPSISSTLDLLEERESPVEKRSGVYVTGDAEMPTFEKVSVAAGRARSASASIGRSSGEALRPVVSGLNQSPRRKQRPTLPTLLTSTSSPQLRTLAAQCSVLSAASSTTTLLPSPLAVTPDAPDRAHGAPLAGIPFMSAGSPTDRECQLPSRWSLDSVASRPVPSNPTSPSESQSSNKGKTRDRLISFISRGRSGSVGKTAASGVTVVSQEVLDIGRRSVSKEPQFEMVSPRPSLSTLGRPLPITPSTSSSASSSPSSSEISTPSTLPTSPEFTNASPAPVFHDPFSTSSPSFVPPESTQSRDFSESHHLTSAPGLLASPFKCSNGSFQDGSLDSAGIPGSLPPEPTLPLPSPGTPSPSFFNPQRPQSFFSSLALKRRARRRGKKLVITGVLPFTESDHWPGDQAPSDLDTERRQRERKKRYENVVHWCENFGALRKIERKEDGSLHVYWRDWEVADMVCRVQAQVYIKGVGRVTLAWHYIS